MRIKAIGVVAGGACMVAALGVGGHVAVQAVGGVSTAGTNTTAADTTTPSASVDAEPTPLLVSSQLPSAACVLESVPSEQVLGSLDPRVADMAKTTPFSQALDPRVAPSREHVVDSAIDMSSDVSRVTAVAVTRVSYADAGPIMNDVGNPLLNPTRCVWVVSVDGPNMPESYPPGAKPVESPRYTVTFDAASGELLDLLAGPDAPSLITGQGLGR